MTNILFVDQQGQTRFVKGDWRKVGPLVISRNKEGFSAEAKGRTLVVLYSAAILTSLLLVVTYLGANILIMICGIVYLLCSVYYIPLNRKWTLYQRHGYDMCAKWFGIVIEVRSHKFHGNIIISLVDAELSSGEDRIFGKAIVLSDSNESSFEELLLFRTIRTNKVVTVYEYMKASYAESRQR